MGRAPQIPIRIGEGGGPHFLLSLFPFLPPPSWTREGGNLLLVGVGIPPWGRTIRPAGPLLPSFKYGGGGTP